MDNFDKREQPPSQIEAAKKSMIEVFQDIHLEAFVPRHEGRLRIGILGAGVAIEAKALQDYFKSAGGGQQIHIEAYDLDKAKKILTEQIVRDDVDLTYRIANIADPDTFAGEEFDILIIRNPDVHSHPDSWGTGLERAYKTLIPGGVIIATTIEHREFLEQQFKKLGASCTFFSIPKKNQIVPFFSEDSLYFGMKLKQEQL